jgi:hypothetical protein
MPETYISQRAICILAPASGRKLFISQAMAPGGYSALSFKEQNQMLTIREDEPFNSYREKGGALYSGFHEPVSLYPSDSAFGKEKWIAAHRDQLKVGLMIGLGGSLDGFAGTVKRAPRLFIRLNLEWFYRLLKQPSRIGRMMKLPKFIFGTIFSKKKG